MTHALLAGSAAIDNGDSGGTTVDQRGFVRPVDYPQVANASVGEDIGAYELDPLLRVTQIQMNGTSVVLSFLTVSEGLYRIDTTLSLASGNWSVAASSLAGNGGVVNTVIGSGGATICFYRIVRQN